MTGRPEGSSPGGATGRYRCIEGRQGGMGVVYLCHDREAGGPVALKTFLPQYLNSPATRVRFLQEAANWVALGAHPHVVRAHRVEQLGRPARPYVVLDWIVARGGAADPSLAVRLYKRPPLPFGRTLRYALHIVRGMRHARARIPGLVHRDLKPGNILIGADDLARVTDFGLARSYDGIDRDLWRAARTRRPAGAHQAPGTAPYCAPEQWDPSAMADERTDVYALGCIIFEMLTGRRAAAGEAAEMRDVHLRGRLAPIPGDLPEAIGEVLRRCTATRPDDRFAGWNEVEDALSEAHLALTGENLLPDAGGEEPAAAPEFNDTYRALGRSYLDLGQWPSAIACFEHGVALAAKGGSPAREAQALHDLGLATMQAGRPAEAVPLLQRALALARRAGDQQLQSDALSTLGGLRARLGQHGRARAALEHAMRLARQRGDPDGELAALGNLGNACAEGGELHQAVEYFERLLERLAEQPAADPVTRQQALGNLGAALLALGQPARALAHLENAHALAEEYGDIPGRVHVLGLLCEALAAGGDRERLAERARDYQRLARESGDPASERRARRFIETGIPGGA